MGIDMPNRDNITTTLEEKLDEAYKEISLLRNAKIEVKAEKDKLEAERDKLLDQIAWFKRKLFGQSSEKYIPEDPNQFKIDFDGLEELDVEKEIIAEAETEVINYTRKKPQKDKKKPVRLPLPEDLRRVREVIDVEGIDDRYIRIGEEITEILEHKPGELYVRQIVRPKYALKPEYQDLEENPISIADLPVLPLPRSNAGSSLLAEVLMDKYVFHMPFHRQIAKFKMQGIRIPASTMNDWFKGSCNLLKPLYEKLKEEVLASDYIQVDESTVPVINNEKHKTVKAYLWMVRSVMKNIVFFHYDQGSRSQKTVVSLLKGFQGAIQSDGYEAYNIYERKKGVLLLGCWAHARRKFEEALKEDPGVAGYALAQIGKFYTVEHMADDKDMNFEERAALRKRIAYPLMRAFEKWIIKYYPNSIKGGRMSNALSYTYNIFPKLARYSLDGRYKIDNNLAENAIRPLALGRKNYLFCGNHEAAENAAMVYSLLGCCKAADVNPRDWLADVLGKMAMYKTDSSIDLTKLLPANWKEIQ